MAKQVLNKAASNRLISKQECMIMLADYPLVQCSEKIDEISLSKNSKIVLDKDKKTSDKRLLTQYEERPKEQENFTLHDFYKFHNPGKVPHYVGMNGSPTFPVTENYARSIIITHVPWRKYPYNKDWIQAFNEFINGSDVPDSVRLSYCRVVQRHITKTTFCEPTQTQVDHSKNKVPTHCQVMMDLTGLQHVKDLDFNYQEMMSLDRGFDYDWSKTEERDLHHPDIPPETWLNEQVKKQLEKDENGNDEVTLPHKINVDGSVKKYYVEDLKQDQKNVVAVVMQTLQEWLHCKTAEDFKKFKPLRMILNGQGGCGKSVVVNTIVTLFREMFQRNDVIRVLAPTGTAAFNVGGETLHRFVRHGIASDDYERNSMSDEVKKSLLLKFRHLLALVIDERSLLGAKLFGTCRQKITEAIFNGHGKDHPWGGLPIVILVGDDYQLPPSFDTGACHSIDPKQGSRSKSLGQDSFNECAENVMHLHKNLRANESQEDTRQLLQRLRIDELDEEKGESNSRLTRL